MVVNDRKIYYQFPVYMYHMIGIHIIANIQQIRPPICSTVLRISSSYKFPQWTTSCMIEECRVIKDHESIYRGQSKMKSINSKS